MKSRLFLSVQIILLPFVCHAQQLFEKNFHDVAIDSVWLSTADTCCSFRIPTKGITDQKNSGRCWYFSTLNVLRAEAMKNNPELGEFYFSFVFGQYWDLYEKSRHWLYLAEKNYKAPSRSRIDDFLYKKPIGDGGHFLNAAHLIDKYGLVPLDVMPEVYSSSNNVPLMNALRTLLRKYGIQYRQTPRKNHDEITRAAMAEITKLLDKVLGTPPSEFEWQGRKWTPITFRDRYVKHNMESDYALLANDPSLPYYRVYEVDESRNCLEYGNWRFLNLPAQIIDSLGVASLRGGKMYCISADVSHDCEYKKGIYDTRLHKYPETLGIDLDMDKYTMALACESRSEHAVAVCGVRLNDKGQAEKWLIENSFGTARGWDGFVIMGAAWLDKYQWRCIVEKQFLPDSLLKLLDKPTKHLPMWYPLY